MAQRTYAVSDLPDSAIEASATFVQDHLSAARALLGDGDDLVIILRPAKFDHKEWRRMLARDLARAHAPLRVNVIAGEEGDSLTALLAYLDGAKGVTGHYLETHE